MNDLEQQAFDKLKQYAVDNNLLQAGDYEDEQIDNEYTHFNFKMPDFDEIAAKEVFNAVIGFLNDKQEIVISYKFGKLKSTNKYYVKLIFDTNEHALMFVENEISDDKLFPNVETKYLEDKTLICIYGVK